jgi:hypothetical protein
MWPIYPVALLRKPLPANAKNTETVSVLELGHMLQAKGEAAASELGVQQMVIRRGFIRRLKSNAAGSSQACPRQGERREGKGSNTAAEGRGIKR